MNRSIRLISALFGVLAVSATSAQQAPSDCPCANTQTHQTNQSPSIAVATVPARPAAPTSESKWSRLDPYNHAFELHIDSGWIFDFPGVQAAVVTPTTSAVSPVENTHIAPSAGATYWMTRWLGGYGDVVGIDAGSASASVDGFSASASGSATGLYGGFHIQTPFAARPYFDIGGGVLDSSIQGTLLGESEQASETNGSFRSGLGLRLMRGERWGIKLSSEAYFWKGDDDRWKISPRIGIGLFWQTKKVSNKKQQ